MACAGLVDKPLPKNQEQKAGDLQVVGEVLEMIQSGQQQRTAQGRENPASESWRRLPRGPHAW